MANTAFGHDATLTTPGSTTNTALVRWANTSGNSLGNTANILSDGSNITLNARGEVRFADADSSHYIALEAPATVSTTYTMALPAAVPSANDYLKVTSYSGGAGVLEWATAGGALTPWTSDIDTDGYDLITNDNNEDINIIPHGTGKVGIGTASPAKLLHLYQGAHTGGTSRVRASAMLVLEDDSTDEIALQFLMPGGSGTPQQAIYFGDDGDGTMGGIVYDHIDNEMRFRTSGSNRMFIENGGTLSMNGYNIEKAGKIGTDPNAGPRGIGDFSKTDTGAEVRFYVENKATSGGNGVAIDLSVGGASAGDCLMQFDNNGIQGYILALDSSESRFVIGRAYATYQDQIRISNGNTITYASSHPTGTHDYVCDICGKYSHEIFTCCGPVKWHDDVLAIRNAMMSLITETDPYNPALTLNVDHMSKLGVFDLDLDEDGLPKIQGNGEPYFGIDIEKAQWYTWAGMWQNRERMDAQHDELKAEIANLKMELAALKS